MAKKSTRLQALHSTFNENGISPDIIADNDSLIREIKKNADAVPDYRHPSYVKHLLGDIIMIVFFALLGNADEWGEIESFAKKKEKWLRKYLELPYSIPTDDTYRIVIGNINTDHFFQVTVQLLLQTVEGILDAAGALADVYEKGILAVDGKVSRGSGRKETADAMNCQKETAAIIHDGKREYVLALKGNQGLFYEEVKKYFDEECLAELGGKESSYKKTVEAEHGGIAVREYYITEETGWFSEKKLWKGLKSFGMVHKELKKVDGSSEEEDRYYICSIGGDVEEFERAARGHWGVENGLHWHLDFTFGDERMRDMAKTGAKNLQTMKKIVLAILGLVKESYKLSMKRIRYELSLDYENGVEKMMSMLDVGSIRKVLESKGNSPIK